MWQSSDSHWVRDVTQYNKGMHSCLGSAHGRRLCSCELAGAYGHTLSSHLMWSADQPTGFLCKSRTRRKGTLFWNLNVVKVLVSTAVISCSCKVHADYYRQVESLRAKQCYKTTFRHLSVECCKRNSVSLSNPFLTAPVPSFYFNHTCSYSRCRNSCHTVFQECFSRLIMTRFLGTFCVSWFGFKLNSNGFTSILKSIFGEFEGVPNFLQWVFNIKLQNQLKSWWFILTHPACSLQ